MCVGAWAYTVKRSVDELGLRVKELGHFDLS